jgi:hypothetical protein
MLTASLGGSRGRPSGRPKKRLAQQLGDALLCELERLLNGRATDELSTSSTSAHNAG